MKIGSITRLIEMVHFTEEYSPFESHLKLNEIDNKYIPFLYALYRLVRFTDFVPEHVRKILEPDMTYQKSADYFGLKLGTIKAEVTGFNRKLCATFKKDILGDILDKKEIDDEFFKQVDVIVWDLLSQREPHIEANFKNNFTVNVLSVPYNEEIFSKNKFDDATFEKIIIDMAFYSLKMQQYYFRKMNSEYKQYVSYLLNTVDGKLDNKDRHRKRKLIDYCMLDVDD
ncbi:MAG TPA: hypothetical protein DCM73_13220 [Clostridiales bacterium]|nr:hypothetical protein [Clostridiales bacterium]